jgi:N-acetylneuraminic acid mutarotase
LNHLNTAVVNGKIYVLGGLNNETVLQASGDCFTYNLAVDTWTTLLLAPIGFDRSVSAVGVSGSIIYMAGRLQQHSAGAIVTSVNTFTSYNTDTGV